MYVRRKVFSVLTDEETGEEKLFSTTDVELSDYSNVESDYLFDEERLYCESTGEVYDLYEIEDEQREFSKAGQAIKSGWKAIVDKAGNIAGYIKTGGKKKGLIVSVEEFLGETAGKAEKGLKKVGKNLKSNYKDLKKNVEKGYEEASKEISKKAKTAKKEIAKDAEKASDWIKDHKLATGAAAAGATTLAAAPFAYKAMKRDKK